MRDKHQALIIDDQQGVLEILGAILSSLDHAYDYARTQREARDLLKVNRYCYILLDLEFPADEGITARIQTGFNCLAEIRQRFHRDDLPVIVMTAHENGTEYPIRALQLGANDFAQKDFDEDLEPLDVKIRRVLRHAGDDGGECQRDPMSATPKPKAAGECELRFHGDCRRRRHRMEINGETVWVRLSTFEILWELACVARSAPPGWVPGRRLSTGNYHNAVSRLKRDLTDVAGLDGSIIQNDGHGCFRLAVGPENVSFDADALRVHMPALLRRSPVASSA